jgi:hypothetical protein
MNPQYLHHVELSCVSDVLEEPCASIFRVNEYD